MAKKILIVEDDKVLAETMQSVLTDTGLYEIAVAHDGQTGLKLAEEYNPDMIILDLLMPDVTGLDMLAKWKATGLTDRIPVTVATNLEQVQVMNRALTFGVHSYFIKSEMSAESIVQHCAKVLSEHVKPNTTGPKQT
jgi:CheY-like chemotaxis protein